MILENMVKKTKNNTSLLAILNIKYMKNFRFSENVFTSAGKSCISHSNSQSKNLKMDLGLLDDLPSYSDGEKKPS